MRIKFTEKQNKDIKQYIKLAEKKPDSPKIVSKGKKKHVSFEPEEDKPKSPAAIAKEKKKHVAFVEQAKNVVVGPSKPIVRVFKPKFKYV